MAAADDVTIAVLLPDLLGTYSDRGNALILAQRARWRGIRAHVVDVDATATPPSTCDIYLLGGGEDAAQVSAAAWLAGHPALVAALATTAQTLAVCAGMQILGRTFTDAVGRSHDGLGILDLRTAPGRRRAVGEVITQSELPGVGRLTGFENHRGVTTLGDAVSPLGCVLAGVGNGTRRDGVRVEGAVTDRVIATYLHGPVLARNPALADRLLGRVLGAVPPPLPDDLVPDQAAARDRALAAPARRGGRGRLGWWRE